MYPKNKNKTKKTNTNTTFMVHCYNGRKTTTNGYHFRANTSAITVFRPSHYKLYYLIKVETVQTYKKHTTSQQLYPSLIVRTVFVGVEQATLKPTANRITQHWTTAATPRPLNEAHRHANGIRRVYTGLRKTTESARGTRNRLVHG